MDGRMEILLFALMICLPAAVTVITGSGRKRGCGGGCATCGNRKTCHKKKREQHR